MREAHETIIVGAGMSALGCARRLREAGRSFLLVGEHLGGRVRQSADGKINYGAYYVTRDYTNTLPFMKLVERVRVTDGHYHTDGRRYSFLSRKMLPHLPALARFALDLRRFRHHYQRMNGLAGDHSRRELILGDPLLRATYHQSAGDYIRERRLDGLFRDYIDHLMWASFFTDPRNVSTFFLLSASLPLIVPMHSFILDLPAITHGFEDSIVYDRVTRVERDGELMAVTTPNGVLHAKNVVMATPMDITNRLWQGPPQPIKRGIDVSYYHVRGKLRPAYEGPTRNFFNSQEAAVISREVDGSYLYFYSRDHITRYFESYEVIARGHWQPALFFLGKQFINLRPEPNVFLANDHDMPSVENAYLNGQHTASLVLRAIRSAAPTFRRGAALTLC